MRGCDFSSSLVNVLKKRKNFFRGIIFALLFACASFSSVSPARADYWGASYAANMMLFNMEQMAAKIKGITLSIVKNAALKVINEKVLSLVNGTLGKASLVITDWKDFIYTQSSKKAGDVVLNDFFQKMFDGKGSGANYKPPVDILSGKPKNLDIARSGVFFEAANADFSSDLSTSINTIKNYPQYLANIGKNTLKSLQSDAIKYTLDKVCPNPSSSLAKGDYACFSEIMKPQNNPRGIPILTEQKYTDEKAKNEKIAETQAGITGYKPLKDSKGFVVTPPQTISDIVSTMQTLSAKAISVAQNPEEFITGVIQSYVNSVVQKTLSKGIAKIDAKVDSTLGKMSPNNIGKQFRK